VVDYQAYMWVDDFAIVPRVRADFASLVWYLSYRHGVPLPNPAQDLYLFDGVQTAIASQVTPADVRRALLDAPLLAEAPDDVLDRLAAGSSIATYEAGEVIVGSGEERDVFVLVDGRARLVMRGAGMTELDVLDHGSGEVLGVLGSFEGADRDAVVVARGDCRVVRIPADAAAAAFASAPGLAAAFEQLGVSRRRRCDRALRRAQRLPDGGTNPPADDVTRAPDPESTP
jgi:hypothetical protein